MNRDSHPPTQPAPAPKPTGPPGPGRLAFDKGRGRGGRGGDHWGPGGKYNPDNTGCGKKVVEFVAVVLAVVLIVVAVAT